MSRIIEFLWLAPAAPLLAAGLLALLGAFRPATRPASRTLAAALAISSVALSLVIASIAFVASLKGVHGFHNLTWFQVGEGSVEIGWILNPLTAVMLVMVALVSLLIFIYSIGYMRGDEHFARFFCFLSFFSAAMLGVVIANSLLLLFICWELVGLASYLLIGFWFHKPSAAAAAKKAFIVTRIGDLAFLMGMVVLYSKTGTLLLYNNGEGFLEGKALGLLAIQSLGPLALTTIIGLLIFAGAVGKSGQVPLHVWLPDAMEGPTPVSALIHAATMVAAGVFLVARLYPLMAAVPSPQAYSALPQIHAVAPMAQPASIAEPESSTTTTTLKVVTWTGVLTALFAAGIAVAQTDIKRILAYSTVSQLGFMMAGLGMGGVAVGMFHLITHAFFKALLFLGAGSVIHGCHGEQDIRRMGGLGKIMPVTFTTYAVGMLALSGFPLLFSGFWSKDAILHSAQHWPSSHLPFYLLLVAALLTAFYMTRQICYVFLGPRPAPQAPPHESSPVMLLPLLVLAGATLLLTFVGTPAWPWFQTFLTGSTVAFHPASLVTPATLAVILTSSVVALVGIALGLRFYRQHALTFDQRLAQRWPETHRLVSKSFFIDHIYDQSAVAGTKLFSRLADRLDRTLLSGAVELIATLSICLGWLSRFADEFLVNKGFDEGCSGLRNGGRFFNRWQAVQPQSYLRIAVAGAIALTLIFVWRSW